MMLQKLYKVNLGWMISCLWAKLLSISYYKIIFKKMGKHVIIVRPMHISPKYIEIKNNVMIWPNARMEGISFYRGISFKPLIEIGSFVGIEQNLHLTCAESIKIGMGTAIASNVTITDINHRYEDICISPENQPIETFPVIIGENCKIYNNSVILPGVNLGKHNIVAANSVVRAGLYPDFVVLAGCPAKVIKKFNPELNIWQKIN